MNHRTKLATMLMGTALTVAFSVPSSAQTLNVNTAELEGKSQECRSLGQFIADRNGVIDGVEPTRVADAVNGDVAQECAAIQATLAQGATGAATDAEGEASVTPRRWTPPSRRPSWARRWSACPSRTWTCACRSPRSP